MWLPGTLLTLLLTISRGEILDVTTIYDLSTVPDEGGEPGEVTGHVHARTNALGLPLSNGFETITSPKNADEENLTCDLNEDKGCSWSYSSDWKVKGCPLQEIKLDQTYNMINNRTSIGFNAVWKNDYFEAIYILFFQDSVKLSKNKILIKFSKYNSHIQIFSDCQKGSYSYSYNLYNNDESFTLGCSNQYYYHPNFDFSDNSFITLNFSDKSLNYYNNLKFMKTISLGFTPDHLQFKMYHSGSTSRKIEPLAIALPALSTNTIGSEIISPLAMLEDIKILCLTLVFNCSEYSRGDDVLHVLAEDLRPVQHHLLTVNNSKAGVNVIHHCASIEKIPRPLKLIVRNLIPITIVRISTYNPKGEDVWPLEPVPYTAFQDISELQRVFPEKQNYHIPVLTYEQSNNYSFTNSCLNGGVVTDEGCACLPGFTGPECEIACGSNKYGQDCGGICSIRSKKCQNMLMCHSITGCRCASGYKGANCGSKCNAGFYGGDCEQICGYCQYPNTCDIYSGKCQLCEPGYAPPYCKNEYVYYTSKPELSSTDYGSILVKFKPSDFKGIGTPELYQIQYKEQHDFRWSISTNKAIKGNENHFGDDVITDNGVIEERIEGLKSGHLYSVRVVLMDANFNKYDGELIQASEIITKCDIPETYDYKMNTEVSASSITVSWSYTNETEHWCPVEKYEVSWEDGHQRKKFTTDNFFIFDDILPNLSFKFQVQAITNAGKAPSSEISVSTKREGSGEIRNLRLVGTTSTSAQISWSPPRDIDQHPSYHIIFKCVKQPACLPGCDNATEGNVTQDQTTVTLNFLLPFTQYLVTITPEGGLGSSIYVGTKSTEPTEIPKRSKQVALRTNTTLTVFWEAAPICSGFLQGYKYLLFKALDSTKILDSRFTTNTSATFHNLTASTEYHVRVFVVTIAGWNPDKFLEIISSTSGTVPEAVRNLTVYKRGRNMLGLRWAAPQSSYGLLKAFTISYSLGSETFSEILELTPCVPWPQLYCHTLQGLKAHRKYSISVSAQNSEVPEDGQKSTVTAVTKESPPTVPEGLKLTNSSSTTINLEWNYPNLANGIIRSFLVSVEETEQFNQDNCCQIFPLLEIPVQEEKLSFKTEVSALYPASTYFVTVSAKTVGMGPSQSLVVHTKPPHQPFTILPQPTPETSDIFWDVSEEEDTLWLPQEPQVLPSNQTEIYMPLIKAHLLLIVVNHTETTQFNNSGILQPKLDTVLHGLISKPFLFYQEYNKQSPSNEFSDWGATPSPSLLKQIQNYQLAAAQVSEYNNEFTVDLRYMKYMTETIDL